MGRKAASCDQHQTAAKARDHSRAIFDVLNGGAKELDLSASNTVR